MQKVFKGFAAFIVWTKKGICEMKETDALNRWSCCKFDGMFDNTVKWIEKKQLLRRDLWKRFVQQFREDADADAGWRCE